MPVLDLQEVCAHRREHRRGFLTCQAILLGPAISLLIATVPADAAEDRSAEGSWEFLKELSTAFADCRSDLPQGRQFDLVGYDENGIVFREDIAGEVQLAYERMVSRATREKLVAYFQDTEIPGCYYGSYQRSRRICRDGARKRRRRWSRRPQMSTSWRRLRALSQTTERGACP